MPKPNFFVIGASKAGTTSLCELLAGHPDVFLSDPKEPHFFTRPEAQRSSREWYEGLFAAAGEARAIGEGSTNYAVVGLHPGVERRLAAYAPDARLVYILRHPLERIESQWVQLRSMGAAPTDFGAAIRNVPEFVEGNLYWKNYCAYRDAFSAQQILLLLFDDLHRDPVGTLSRCFRFLGVDPEIDLEDPMRARNPRSEKRSDSGLLAVMRRIPGFDRIRDLLVPRQVRPAIKKVLTEPVEQRPSWERDGFDWLVDRLRDDTAALLGHLGHPPDFWDLSPRWLERRLADRRRSLRGG